MEDRLEIWEGTSETDDIDIDEKAGPPEPVEIAPADAEHREKKQVFISHKQGPDNEIAVYLHHELVARGYDVYLDVLMPPSTDFKKMIKEKLYAADYVIVLVSPEASDSDWVETEVLHAVDLYKKQGWPHIISVRIGLGEELYEPNLGACLNRFVPIRWDRSDDSSELLDNILRGLKDIFLDQPQWKDISGMEPFKVNGIRKEQIKISFVEPTTLRIRNELREKRKLLWISGNIDVRNYLASCLAVSEQEKNEQIKAVFDISKPRSWSEINNKKISNASIIFRDVTPDSLVGDVSLQKEFESLKRMVSRDNFVIVTSDEDCFSSIKQEMLKSDVLDHTHIEVQSQDYSNEAKRQMFEQMLDFSNQNNRITPTQYNWARNLLGEYSESEVTGKLTDFWKEARITFLQRISHWSPADVEHFVVINLPQAKSRSEVIKSLERKLSLEDDIHSWLMSLDGPTSCFVMTLSILSDRKESDLWEKYKCIVKDLQGINPQLALLPLGVCRQKASPFVTLDGPIQFVDERTSAAIRLEIAKNYREYFIEILPRLKEWSVPQERDEYENESDEERKLRLEEIREIRTGIAQMIGRIGRQRLNEVRDVIEFWAGNESQIVRDAAVKALQQIALDNTGARQALDLLREWCSDFTPGRETHYRACAAAIALGNIVTTNPAAPYSAKALGYLRSLAYDKRTYVRRFVSISLKMIARKVPLRDIENLLERAARKAKESRVLINLASALNQAFALDPQAASALYDKWVESPEPNLRWVAFCSLLIKRGTSYRRGFQEAHFNQERRQELDRLLRQDAATLLDVLFKMRANNYYEEAAADALSQIMRALNEDTIRELARSVAQLPFEDLDATLLPLLQKSNGAYADSLIIEIYKEMWRALLQSPPNLLYSICKVLRQEQTLREGFAGLAALLEREPEGCFNEAVEALANCYKQERKLTHDTFVLLRDIAPSHFEVFISEVYRKAYRQLFNDPVTFVQYVNGGIGHPAFLADLRNILESLASPEPAGHRRELLETIALAYSLNRAEVKQLLAAFDSSDNSLLNSLALDLRYGLLKGAISAPASLVAFLTESLQDPAEWADTLGVLQLLADPGPYGARLRLIDALANAKSANAPVVESLLQDPSLLAWSNLATLSGDVQRATNLRRFFVPRVISDFFRAKR